MTVLRVQCNIPRGGNVPEDDTINVWHFRTVGAATPAAAADDAVTKLGVFYSAIDGNLASYLGNPMRFKVYDLSDIEPRVPILQTTLTLTKGTGPGFPAEVAVALSYRGENISGTNPARRRGRIFIGPLDFDTATTGLNDMTVTSAFRTALVNAAEALCEDTASPDARWVVFSPTEAGPPPWSAGLLLASSADVMAGFVDEAFDTIRSRGARTTNRTTWSAVLP